MLEQLEKTFHTARMQQLPTTSPVISQPSQPMNVDEEGTTQPTPTQAPPSTRLQQVSQMNAELEQRRNTAMKRKEEPAINHRGEVFKESKPTLAQQILNIQPPRVVPENIPISSSGDEALQPVKAMVTTSQPKRGEPETRVEPRGKAGRPKMFKYGTDRADGTKRDGEEPEEERPKRAKRVNKNKEKQQRRLEARMTKETVNIEGDDADDEVEDTRKGSRVRRTIQKPTIPSKANIQTIYEALTNTKNKNIVTAE